MRGWCAAFVLGAMLLAAPARAEAPAFPVVRPGVILTFPADHGSHPAFRTEWWYATGWLRTPDGEDLGFQVTFFRSRTLIARDNPSAFSPRQVLFAHAALSDPAQGRLLHGQRIAREGFGLAQAAVGDADIRLDDWRFKRLSDGRFAAKAVGEGFGLDLILTQTQPVMLQGQGGYSRKGPRPEQASYYYSLPQLKVSGSVVRGGRKIAVSGVAWLDREWSSTLLDPKAVGWDWVGLNLDDGGALMAFQVRGADGRALWTGGAFRSAGGDTVPLANGAVSFSSSRVWRSPRTGAAYPIERTVTARIGGRERSWALKPMFDDQELDSRASGGPVYWEGAVRGAGARGYLELTGYLTPMKL